MQNGLDQCMPQGHVVQLYEADEGLLTRNVGHYLWEGLNRGDGLLVIATPARNEAVARRLQELGADPETAVREKRLSFLHAQETLAQFMIHGQPEWRLFENTIEAAIRERNMTPGWTAKSLALHTQAVLQGAFILAKATGGAEIAADSIDHLRRYIELLFGVGTEPAQPLTDGDSQ